MTMELEVIKEKQQKTWTSGNYAVSATLWS